MRKSVGLFKERVAGHGEIAKVSQLRGISVYKKYSRCVFLCQCRTSVIIGNPRMKKKAQQTRVKSGLCFLKYLGNSSDTEVTMVSMVANWDRDEWEEEGRNEIEPEKTLIM